MYHYKIPIHKVTFRDLYANYDVSLSYGLTNSLKIFSTSLRNGSAISMKIDNVALGKVEELFVRAPCCVIYIYIYIPI